MIMIWTSVRHYHMNMNFINIKLWQLLIVYYDSRMEHLLGPMYYNVQEISSIGVQNWISYSNEKLKK